jgi:WD40 repeat protein
MRNPSRFLAPLLITAALVGCSPSKPSGSGSASPAPGAAPAVAADLQVLGPAAAIDPQFAPDPKRPTGQVDRPEVSGLEFSRDGNRLLVRSAEAKNGLQVWTVGDSPARLRSWDLTRGLLSPDGRRVVTNPPLGITFIADVDSGQKVIDLKAQPGSDLSFGPPDLLFGFNSSSDTRNAGRSSILTIDAATGEKRAQFDVHEGVGILRTSRPFAEGRQVAVVHTADPVIDVWDLTTQKRVRQVKPPFETPGGRTAPIVNPTGSRMADGVPPGTRLNGEKVGGGLVFWDGQSGESLAYLPDEGGNFRRDFVPGRDVFLMASNALREEKRGMPPEVVAYDLGKKAYTGVFRGGHQTHVTALAVSADGRWLATGDKAGTVRLWDLRQLR